MVCVSVFQTGQNGKVRVFALTLWKYPLKKDDLFILSLAKVQRVCQGRGVSLWCL